jgi:hypothetical protein
MSDLEEDVSLSDVSDGDIDAELEDDIDDLLGAFGENDDDDDDPVGTYSSDENDDLVPAVAKSAMHSLRDSAKSGNTKVSPHKKLKSKLPLSAQTTDDQSDGDHESTLAQLTLLSEDRSRQNSIDVTSKAQKARPSRKENRQQALNSPLRKQGTSATKARVEPTSTAIANKSQPEAPASNKPGADLNADVSTTQVVPRQLPAKKSDTNLSIAVMRSQAEQKRRSMSNDSSTAVLSGTDQSPDAAATASSDYLKRA